MRFLFSTCLLIFLCVISQYSIAQFRLIGDAAYMMGDCIRLTPDEEYTSGMAYHERKLDLSRYFEIEFDIYFGDKDLLGADGIAFVIHNDPRGYEAFGFWGEGLGYGRIYPSVAVEFDTYQNRYRNDPYCDHVAYLENGLVFQNEYWNNEDPEYNIEDDRRHNFRFRWNPKGTELTVFLDNSIVFQGKRDLVNEVFDGQTQVIWGFTASTGRKHNLQYFCLRKWTNNDKFIIGPSPAKWLVENDLSGFPKLEEIELPKLEKAEMVSSVEAPSKTLILTDDLVGASPQGGRQD